MGSSTLPREDIEDLLYHCIPKDPSGYIDDSVFLEVGNLLSRHPDDTLRQWSKDPRTYTLLRILGHEDYGTVFTTFDEQKIGDIWLPLASKFLPDLLPSSESSSPSRQWFQKQSHVLSKPDLMSLSHLESAHTHRYIVDGEAHFKDQEELGRGGSAQVWRVRHNSSGKEYACKRILRHDSIKQQREQLKQFRQEMQVLQRVHHKHIVNYVASYTDLFSFALVLSPVADDVLSSVLERQSREKPLQEAEITSLRSAFGCLANALAYAHDEKVRHKDIKPGNILVSNGSIFLCDFGISFDWSESGESTTSGHPFRFTTRYCAPEVYNREPRNSKSDIWSLGCVFLEMITVIKGYPLDEMNKYIGDQCENGMNGVFYNAAGPMKSWLDHIRSQSADDLPLDWITTLIRSDPNDRPTAKELVKMIYKESRSLPEPDLFIGKCCSKTNAEPRTPDPGLGISIGTPEQPLCRLPTQQSPQVDAPRPASDRSISPKGSPPTSTFGEQRDGTISAPTTPVPAAPFGHIRRASSRATSPSVHTSTTSDSVPGSSVSTIFRRPPVAPPADHAIICFCSEREHETHIFNAPISSVNIRKPVQTIETFERCEIGACRVQIYETLPGNFKMGLDEHSTENVAIPQLWWVTRRLVVSYEIGTPPVRHCSSFWLPLADLDFGIDEREVKLEWSDCNQMTNKPTANKGESYDWLYLPNKPNNSISLTFQDLSDAEYFVDCVRLPAEDGVTVRNRRHIQISDTQEAHIFDIGRNARVGNIIDYRAVVLTNVDQAGSQTSKLYIRWQDLDLDMRVFGADPCLNSTMPFHHMRVKLDSIATPRYRSDIVGEPAADDDRVASFKEAVQIKSFLTATFPIESKHYLPIPPNRVVTFLHALTGWTLCYFAIVSDYKEPRHGFHLSKSYGAADIMLWEKEVKHSSERRWSSRITFRKHQENDEVWTSASITKSTKILTSSGREATIKVTDRRRGALLDAFNMRATTARENDDGRSRRMSEAQDKTAELILTFQDSDYCVKFFNLIDYLKKAAAACANPLNHVSSADTTSGRR